MRTVYMLKALTATLVLGALLGRPARASAQQPLQPPAPTTATKDSATDTNGTQKAAAADLIAYPVPQSPAFDLLGASPAKVSRPATAKSLVTSLANGINQDGKVQQGIAFEFAPGTYVGSMTLHRYQSFQGFLVANLKLSLATVRTAGDSAATDGAFGIRIPIFDHSDPLADPTFTTSIGTVVGKCAPGNAPNGGPDTAAYNAAKTTKCIADSTDIVVKAYAQRHWNSSALAFSGAMATRFNDSDVRAGRNNGGRGSVGWAFGAGQRWQFVTTGNILRHNATSADSSYDARNVGARAVFGGPHIDGFVEGVGEWRWHNGSAVDRTQRLWSAGIEFLATDNTWISTGFGDGYKAKGAPDRTVLLLGVRWGVSAKSRLIGGG